MGSGLTKLGFVIDHRVCIGCHACTVACKSENDIPVGDFRTWVKLVEAGEFPNTKRSFLIERCNHCEHAPCVGICPVNALFKRPDGIVDFNNDQCIGCRACQAACPYDAIYMDRNRGHTVAKCNFCSHRIDQGLEPACVVVCPTQAILFGDLDDPASVVARASAGGNGAGPALRPRAELGTRPQLAYLGTSLEVMSADRTSERAAAMMTSPWDGAGAGAAPSLAETRLPHDVYNVRHASPWHLFVTLYMGAKSLAAGSALVAAAALAFGAGTERDLLALWGPIFALLFAAATAGFLVFDLERPERFLRVLLQPNWGSWLARGAYILVAFSALAAVWLVLELTGAEGGVRAAAWVMLAVGAATAVYTAFLFWQAPGRELWRSRAFAPHLLARAVVAGAAVWVVVGALADAAADLQQGLAWALVGGLAVSLLSTAAEFSRRGTAHLRRASALALRGRLAGPFWAAVVAGHAVPIALALAYLAGGGDVAVGLLAGAAALALAGQFVQDEVWVRAGQAVSQT